MLAVSADASATSSAKNHTKRKKKDQKFERGYRNESKKYLHLQIISVVLKSCILNAGYAMACAPPMF